MAAICHYRGVMHLRSVSSSLAVSPSVLVPAVLVPVVCLIGCLATGCGGPSQPEEGIAAPEPAATPVETEPGPVADVEQVEPDVEPRYNTAARQATCVTECQTSRQMEARAAEAIEADCRTECTTRCIDECMSVVSPGGNGSEKTAEKRRGCEQHCSNVSTP